MTDRCRINTTIALPQVIPQTLYLESPTLNKPLVLDLTQGPAELARLKKEPSVSQSR